ncbi:MAG: hypothetical protein M3N05_07430, partial [Pseudomonadota bacterium]|nr:hypothetical protein [Pseudomonadota bacterium]
MKLLRLDGGDQTLLVALTDAAPTLAYWGEALPPGAEQDLDPALLDRAIPHGMLDGGERFDLFPEAGRGFTGRPALECHRPSGAFVTQLAFADVKPVENGHAVLLRDALAEVEVALTITLD